MPIYEYSCEDCGNQYDAFRSVEERELACSCPRCASTRSRVLFSTSFTIARGGHTGSTARATREFAQAQTGRSPDDIEPRHPLPEHWSRYPRTLDEAI